MKQYIDFFSLSINFKHIPAPNFILTVNLPSYLTLLSLFSSPFQAAEPEDRRRVREPQGLRPRRLPQAARVRGLLQGQPPLCRQAGNRPEVRGVL